MYWKRDTSKNLEPYRKFHSCINVNNELVVFGGCTANSEYLSDVRVLDKNKKCWVKHKVLGGMPVGRARHGCVALPSENKMLIFGGSSQRKFNDMWEYDFGTNRWHRIITNDKWQPCPREGCTLSIIDNKLIVFGGRTSEGLLNDTHIFDLNSKSWLPIHPTGNIPSPRCSHTAIVYGGSMFVFGGEGIGNLFKVHQFDPHTQLWTECLSPNYTPSFQGSCVACGLGDRIVVLQRGSFKEAFIFNCPTKEWTRTSLKGPLPKDIWGYSMCTLGSDIYVIGGWHRWGGFMGEAWKLSSNLTGVSSEFHTAISSTTKFSFYEF